LPRIPPRALARKGEPRLRAPRRAAAGASLDLPFRRLPPHLALRRGYTIPEAPRPPERRRGRLRHGLGGPAPGRRWPGLRARAKGALLLALGFGGEEPSPAHAPQGRR